MNGSKIETKLRKFCRLEEYFNENRFHKAKKIKDNKNEQINLVESNRTPLDSKKELKNGNNIEIHEKNDNHITNSDEKDNQIIKVDSEALNLISQNKDDNLENTKYSTIFFIKIIKTRHKK